MYLNEDKTKLFSRDSNEVSAGALAAKRDRKKNNFPFSIFNARKIIFTIIAAFSTIKTVLFALWRAAEDERAARAQEKSRGSRNCQDINCRHFFDSKSLKHLKSNIYAFSTGF